MARDYNKSEMLRDEHGKLVRDINGNVIWGERKPRAAERSGHYWQYLDDNSPDPPMPSKPLTSLPGTLDRINELEQRAARGEHLWHPADPASFDGFQGDFRDISIFGNGPRKEQRKRGSSRIG